MSRDILGDLDDESKMLVITLGSNEKERDWILPSEVISSFPKRSQGHQCDTHRERCEINRYQLLRHCKMLRS